MSLSLKIPRYRFMRYIHRRPRNGSRELPSFPMRPETWHRVGVDVETIRVLSVELLEILAR